MRKLYTDVTLETPFMVSYNDGQIQACANDEDTITIGAVEFIRVTDADGHNVSDTEGNQLLLSDGIIYKLVSGVPESTNVQVTDVTAGNTYSLTVTCSNAELTDVSIIIYSNDWTYSGISSEGKTLTVSDIPEGTDMNYSVAANGYNSESGNLILTSNETVSVSLTEPPSITLNSNLSIVNEIEGGMMLKDSTGEDYILSSAGNKIFYSSDGYLLEQGTNSRIIDSATGIEISINPFTLEIVEQLSPTGYSVTSLDVGGAEFNLVNEGAISPETASMELYAGTGGFSTYNNPQPITSQTHSVLFSNILAGVYVNAYIKVGNIYEATGIAGVSILPLQSDYAELRYTITEKPHGTASITFTNTGNITATTANCLLKVSSYEGYAETTISSADIDNGSISIPLVSSSFDSYYIQLESIDDTNYTLTTLQSQAFTITDNETTNVSVTFDITQD